jgi:hypothetical protein
MNSFRNIRDSHFHIRWNEKNVLVWECFDTREEAEAQARELAAWNETFTIEAVSQECPTRPRM